MVVGVIGSTCGRYMLSMYIPWLSDRYITVQKNEDLKFVGERLSKKGWQVQLFVFIYTLVPMPSTPLFTAAGMARIPAIQIIPAFFAGKFISDMVMVLTGEYVAKNASVILQGWFTWNSLLAIIPGIIVLVVPLFIDWRVLMERKKFQLNFRIWK